VSDRLLEKTGVIPKGKQFLDRLAVERERGITVKAQTCSMLFHYKSKDYLLHLVDTPGHVDFAAEVAQNMASCDGALLLVDASQGVQAQTLANLRTAVGAGLVVLPLINKIDLVSADVARTTAQVEELGLMHKPLLLSAKTGIGIDAILPWVVDNIPPPKGSTQKPLRFHLVDSWFDAFAGVILLIRVLDGVLEPGQKIFSTFSQKLYSVAQVGIMHPDQIPTVNLSAGQVGYCIPRMKSVREAIAGDIFTHPDHRAYVDAPVLVTAKPMVFVGAFPLESSEFSRLDESIGRLALNDRSITVSKEASSALGQGWRIGFRGTLHASVFQDRLRQEHGGRVIITRPTVPYKILSSVGETIVSKADEFPDATQDEILEPVVDATMVFPSSQLGRVIDLCETYRGNQLDITYSAHSHEQVKIIYRIPLAQLVDGFFDKLKSLTQGYATLDYEEAGWAHADVVKLKLLVNHVPIDALSAIVHHSQAVRWGREWTKRLKEMIPQQLYVIAIQAAIGSKVVARETLSARRKDVTAKLYGGDITRRMKLLEKQRQGKKKLTQVSTGALSHETLSNFLKE